MELRHLETLVEVVRRGGFSAAAKTLKTTQSTVSKAVSQLEHDCGAPLLERLGQGVRLTSAGETVFRRAAGMLSERDKLKAELARLHGLETGRLRLGLPTLGSSVLFAPLLATYRKRYPGIDIDLIEHGSRRLEEALRAGEIEVGATLWPSSDEFDWQLVRDEPMMALLPSGHPLCRKGPLKLKDLVSTPFIFFDRGFALNAIIASACHKRGLNPVEVARSGNPDFIIALVAAGLGVAMLPRLEIVARGKLSIETALVDESDLRWRLGLIWRQGASLSPAAVRWLALAKEQSSASQEPRAQARKGRRPESEPSAIIQRKQ
jgi:DNA-binding transcriptional LysR family regulator